MSKDSWNLSPPPPPPPRIQLRCILVWWRERVSFSDDSGFDRGAWFSVMWQNTLRSRIKRSIKTKARLWLILSDILKAAENHTAMEESSTEQERAGADGTAVWQGRELSSNAGMWSQKTKWVD